MPWSHHTAVKTLMLQQSLNREWSHPLSIGFSREPPCWKHTGSNIYVELVSLHACMHICNRDLDLLSEASLSYVLVKRIWMCATTTSLCMLNMACRCAKPWLALLVHKENFFLFLFFLNKKKGIIAFYFFLTDKHLLWICVSPSRIHFFQLQHWKCFVINHATVGVFYLDWYRLCCFMLLLHHELCIFACPEVFHRVLEVHGRRLIDLKVQRIAV